MTNAVLALMRRPQTRRNLVRARDQSGSRLHDACAGT